MKTVVCVLKKSSYYNEDHVNFLYKGVSKNLTSPFRFICLTDSNKKGVFNRNIIIEPLGYGLPNWWSKMEMFRIDLLDMLGDFLYFDLDTVIVDNIDLLFEADELFTMLSDFYKPKNLASGVMLVPKHCREAIWRKFMEDPQANMQKHFRGGDQEFIAKNFEAYRFDDGLPSAIVSYKVHVKPNNNEIPQGACVVCFHGQPKVEQLEDLKWVKEHYYGI